MNSSLTDHAKKLRASLPVKRTFDILLKAYLADRPLSGKDALYIEDGDLDEQVRSRVSTLRQALKGLIFSLPGSKSLEFEIPEGAPYRLQEAETSSVALLWAPHMHHKEAVIIQTFERLFFRRESLYVRDLRVNRVEDAGRIADTLKLPREEFSASMHYVSSGELRAAITLQNFFVNWRQRAQLNSGPDLNEETAARRNLILLGAARVAPTHLDALQHEKFRIADYGVKPDLRDKTIDGYHRTVYVLMTRRRGWQRDSLHTVFESSHGRAIHGVCAKLVDAEANLCADVVARLRKGTDLLQETFQVVFRVLLAPGQHYISLATQVDVEVCETYPKAAAARKR